MPRHCVFFQGVLGHEHGEADAAHEYVVGGHLLTVFPSGSFGRRFGALQGVRLGFRAAGRVELLLKGSNQSLGIGEVAQRLPSVVLLVPALPLDQVAQFLARSFLLQNTFHFIIIIIFFTVRIVNLN